MEQSKAACDECGEKMPEARARRRAKYCTNRCALTHNRKKYSPTPFQGIATGTVGTIAELLVAIDLLRKGYDVYRALSPSSGADLAVLVNGKLLRIEVRTGYQGINGKVNWPKFKRDRMDVYAIVIHSTTSTIHYVPPLSELLGA